MADTITDTTGANVPAPADTVDNSTDAMGQTSRISQWKSRIARIKRLKRDVIPDWSENIDWRRGKPFAEDSDYDRIQVPFDWSATKAKQAQLFSQVPELRLTPFDPAFKAAAPMFAKKVNRELRNARIGTAMDEVLPDCINAAGFGVILAAYETLTEPREVNIVDQQTAAQMQQRGQKVPTKTMDVVLDARFTAGRISPADALWAAEFAGSDFEDSPWVGHTGRKTWVDACRKWKQLTDADKASCVGTDARSTEDRLTGSDDTLRFAEPDMVEYDEAFYRRHLFHDDETDFYAIHHLVFVRGKQEPVVDEPWQGQQRDARQKIVGPRRYPLQFLTLTYISDECIPPSDTAMGRPQVTELNKSRSTIIKNREASIPLRWFNVNLVDPQVQTMLMKGTWQGMIPMNGDGARALGEVARASYPVENFNFDNIVKQDLRETWQIEDAVDGGPAIRSATEANNRQKNFTTRIGYERAKCAKMFVGTAEVVAGLVALFGVFTPEEQKALVQPAPVVPGQPPADPSQPAPTVPMDQKQLASCYAFTVRADSTLLIDSRQRIEDLMSYLNMTVKSGFVNPLPVITEVTELMGLDPADVMTHPQAKQADPVNVSLRLTGAADLDNAMVVAMLMLNGQFPSPDLLNQAKMVIASMQQQPTMPGQPGAPGAPGAPAGPGGAPAMPGHPPVPTPTAGPGVPPDRGPAHNATVAQTDQHPDWNTASRIEKRAQDGK